MVQGLSVGEIAIIRDFVNHHDHSGAHVKSLIFVLLWRDVLDGPIKLLKITNYCSDAATMSTDTYFYRDVADFHLSPKSEYNPGHLDNASHVILIGDHGPHFSSGKAMLFESSVYRTYGKEITSAFYTSYHACGRADGAGAQNKKLDLADFRAGIPRLGAASYTAMTNASNDKRSIAYEFPAINRGQDLYPAKDELNTPKWIRKWCQVTYKYPGRTQETEGIVLYRPVSNIGPWRWGDLRGGRRHAEGPLCTSCSTRYQVITRHEKAVCPDWVDVEVLDAVDFCAHVRPDPARISGQQVLRPSKKAKSVTYPCKFDGCPKKDFKRQAFRGMKRANDHMREVHADWGGLQASLYPVAAGDELDADDDDWAVDVGKSAH
jgi:hypothetical protein